MKTKNILFYKVGKIAFKLIDIFLNEKKDLEMKG